MKRIKNNKRRWNNRTRIRKNDERRMNERRVGRMKKEVEEREDDKEDGIRKKGA